MSTARTASKFRRFSSCLACTVTRRLARLPASQGMCGVSEAASAANCVPRRVLNGVRPPTNIDFFGTDDGWHILFLKRCRFYSALALRLRGRKGRRLGRGRHEQSSRASARSAGRARDRSEQCRREGVASTTWSARTTAAAAGIDLSKGGVNSILNLFYRNNTIPLQPPPARLQDVHSTSRMPAQQVCTHDETRQATQKS